MARPIFTALVVVTLGATLCAPAHAPRALAAVATFAPPAAQPPGSGPGAFVPSLLAPRPFVPASAALAPATATDVSAMSAVSAPTVPPTSDAATTVPPASVPGAPSVAPAPPPAPVTTAPAPVTTVARAKAPIRAVVLRHSSKASLSRVLLPTAPPTTVPTCASIMAVVNERGLFLPAGYRYLCPGLGLAGLVTGLGGQHSYCPCTSNSGVTAFEAGPEGPGPYISIRDLVPSMLAYEICNAILGYDSTGNSHDTQSGGTLLPSTASCAAQFGF